MSKYTDWQDRDATLHAFHDREDAEHAAFCGGCGRRRLATVGELFEGDGQDANGTEPTTTDRHGAG